MGPIVTDEQVTLLRLRRRFALPTGVSRGAIAAGVRLGDGGACDTRGQVVRRAAEGIRGTSSEVGDGGACGTRGQVVRRAAGRSGDLLRAVCYGSDPLYTQITGGRRVFRSSLDFFFLPLLVAMTTSVLSGRDSATKESAHHTG